MSKCTKCNGLGEIVNRWKCLQCDTWNDYNPDYENTNGNITCNKCPKIFNLHNSEWKARIDRNSSICTDCDGSGYISSTLEEKKGCWQRSKKGCLWVFFILLAVFLVLLMISN